MQLTLNEDELKFLQSQLARRIDDVEKELAHTDKHELQHALASDARLLHAIADRLSAR